MKIQQVEQPNDLYIDLDGFTVQGSTTRGYWSVTDNAGNELPGVYDIQLHLIPGSMTIKMERHLSESDNIDAAIIGPASLATMCPRCKAQQFRTELP